MFYGYLLLYLYTGFAQDGATEVIQYICINHCTEETLDRCNVNMSLI